MTVDPQSVPFARFGSGAEENGRRFQNWAAVVTREWTQGWRMRNV